MSGTELGLKLLQSVKEMRAGQAARVTKVELNEVAEARQQTGLSQAQFAVTLDEISYESTQIGESDYIAQHHAHENLVEFEAASAGSIKMSRIE